MRPGLRSKPVRCRSAASARRPTCRRTRSWRRWSATPSSSRHIRGWSSISVRRRASSTDRPGRRGRCAAPAAARSRHPRRSPWERVAVRDARRRPPVAARRPAPSGRRADPVLRARRFRVQAIGSQCVAYNDRPVPLARCRTLSRVVPGRVHQPVYRRDPWERKATRARWADGGGAACVGRDGRTGESGKNGPNNANAKLCKNWDNLFEIEGPEISSQSECVSYLAEGGTVLDHPPGVGEKTCHDYLGFYAPGKRKRSVHLHDHAHVASAGRGLHQARRHRTAGRPAASRSSRSPTRISLWVANARAEATPDR